MRTLRLAALLAVVLAPAADAALPKFKDKTIVIGKSIAGVKMGASKASVKKAWGPSCTVFGTTSCLWRVAGDTSGYKGEGAVAYMKGKVTDLSITAPQAKVGHTFKAPFTTPRTSKGLHIGSTVKQFRKAYPKSKVATIVNELSFTSKLSHKRTLRSSFAFDAKSKRIYAIRFSIYADD